MSLPIKSLQIQILVRPICPFRPTVRICPFNACVKARVCSSFNSPINAPFHFTFSPSLLSLYKVQSFYLSSTLSLFPYTYSLFSLQRKEITLSLLHQQVQSSFNILPLPSSPANPEINQVSTYSR